MDLRGDGNEMECLFVFFPGDNYDLFGISCFLSRNCKLNVLNVISGFIEI